MAQDNKDKAPRGANRQYVLDALRRAGRPMTAYELLEALRDKRITAPPTVYRALNRLVDEGAVHRLESLNAFVACRHPDTDECIAFAICDTCGAVTEITDEDIRGRFADWAREKAFTVRHMTLEIRGLCRDCEA